MSLCIKEMTPMPDARRPFRNQDRKAWREVGEEGEFSISPNPAPKAPQSSQTEGRLVIPPPYPAPDAHHALAPPHLTLCPQALSGLHLRARFVQTLQHQILQDSPQTLEEDLGPKLQNPNLRTGRPQEVILAHVLSICVSPRAALTSFSDLLAQTVLPPRI